MKAFFERGRVALSRRFPRAPGLIGSVVAVACLDAVVNARYPGPEPPAWYLVASPDIVVLLGVLALFGRAGRPVPRSLRWLALALLLGIRLLRFGDGVSLRLLDRPFNLYIQLPLLGELPRLAREALAPHEIALGLLALLAAAAIIGATTAWALGESARAVATTQGRRLTAGVVAGFAVAGLFVSKPRGGAGLFGHVPSSGVGRIGDEIGFLVHARALKRERAEEVRATRERLRKAPHDLSRLRGGDVLLFFVEAYGETVLHSRSQKDRLGPVYASMERELSAGGYHVASGLLESPIFGGQSWLAHATLSSGIRTTDELEYRVLGEAAPPALAEFFEAAGYRTVLVQPATKTVTGITNYLRFEKHYYAADFGYRGPGIGWGTIPDQYSIDLVHRRELEKPHGPTFVEYTLVSSHVPWREVPVFVPGPTDFGDGSLYRKLPITRSEVTLGDERAASAAFAGGIAYDLDVLKAYLLERVRGDTLVVALGDHQPAAGATEGSTTRGVMVHVFSRNPSFVDAFVRRGYTQGMRPREPARRQGLESFLPHFLADFSAGGGA